MSNFNQSHLDEMEDALIAQHGHDGICLTLSRIEYNEDGVGRTIARLVYTSRWVVVPDA